MTIESSLIRFDFFQTAVGEHIRSMRDFPDRATFREKGGNSGKSDKLVDFSSLTQ